jgi:hypothetical protein
MKRVLLDECKRVVCVIAVFALGGSSAVASTKPIPAELFGQNIEHTRSALQGGFNDPKVLYGRSERTKR